MKTVSLLVLPLLTAWVDAAVPRSCRSIATLRQDPEAKPFCTSYLRSTSTVSSGTTTVISRTTTPPKTDTVGVTTTSTETDTSTTTVISTSTVTVTSAGSSSITCASSAISVVPGSLSNGFGSSSAFAKRQATASPTPSALQGQPPASISSSCSCLGATATVTTVTVPASTISSTTTIKGRHTTITTTATSATTTVAVSTITSVVTTTVTAGSVGAPTASPNYLLYYAYQSPYDFGGTPTIDPTIFQNNDYNLTGQVVNVENLAPGYSYPDCYLPGGQYYTHCDYYAAIAQGYFIPPSTQTYTFTTEGNSMQSVDNYVGFWSGDKAYSTWNENNADFIGIREGQDSSQWVGGSFSIAATEGQLIPVTIIYMNGGVAGEMTFDVVGQDGGYYNEYWLAPCSNSPFQP